MYFTGLSPMCSACTDSPKFTMKLAEIYSHMATHDSHSKFWTCDSDCFQLMSHVTIFAQKTIPC